MLFIPYHLGPTLLVALILYPFLDISTFILTTLILDIVPLAITFFGLDLPLHGRFHSLTLGTLVGLILALIINMYRKYKSIPVIETKKIQNSSTKQTIATAIAGIWLHVIVDAFIYSDVKPLYPIKWNPLMEALSLNLIQKICLITFPLTIIICLLRITKLGNKENDENKKTQRLEEPLVTQGTNINFSIPDYLKDIDSGKDNFSKMYPETISNSPIKSLTQPIKENPPFFDLDQSNIIHEEVPEIFIGSEIPPIQWGIIGKSDNRSIGVDLNEPHIVFVSGKQGSGKGYTIGVLSEMLLAKSIPGISNVSKPATIIVFHKPREDMCSEYWSIIFPNQNDKERDLLKLEYNLNPLQVINDKKFRIFVDPFVYINERKKFEKEYDTRVYPIGITPQRLTAEDWPYVLSIGKKSGSMYVKKIFQIIKKTQYEDDFGLPMIKRYIEASDLNPNQKSFATIRLETLQDYLEAGDFLKDLVVGGVNVFDLRKIMMEPDDIFSVMILIISAILNNENSKREQFVFVINEAHDYLRKGLSKDFTDYISYLIRKKRHAGTWLMLDTHFPEDVDPKIIKGSDIKIFHKSDVISSNLLSKIVESTPIPPHQLYTGQAIIRADKSNIGSDKLLVVNIRPRLTHHGGATKTAI
jgi:hypothetical protein